MNNRKFSFKLYMLYCFWDRHNKTWDGDFKNSFCSWCGSEHPDRWQFGSAIVGVGKALFIVALIAIVIAVMGLILFSVSYPVSLMSCRQFAEQNNLEYVYKIFYGCLVNYNNYWVSPDQLVQLLK